MNKKIMFLMCLLMAMVWAAGCSCPAVRPVVAAPPPRGGAPAAAAAPGPGASCRTCAGGARSFEEAEETRLLNPRSDILRGNPG